MASLFWLSCSLDMSHKYSLSLVYAIVLQMINRRNILFIALLLAAAQTTQAQYQAVSMTSKAPSDLSGTTNSRLENSNTYRQETPSNSADRNTTNTRPYENRPAINYSSNAAGNGYPTPPQNYENAIISGTGRTLDEIRTTNYNAYGAASGTQYMNPGTGTVAPHYNPVQRRYYYYCTSEFTQKKSRDIHNNCKDSTDPTLRLRKDDDYTYWQHGIPPYTVMQEIMRRSHTYKDWLLTSDNTAKHSNSAQFFSFDGYIVYENDTIPGIVTITQNQVSLEKKADGNKRRFYLADLKDPQLSAITVFKGPKELHLVRLTPTDKHLSRQVHNGRLMLYDRSYNFLTTENIDNTLLAVSAKGTQKIKGKNELAEVINKTYALQIDITKTSKEELIRIMNRQD
jgi:hypothetical protein